MKAKETITYISGIPTTKKSLFAIKETKNIDKVIKELEEDEETKYEVIGYGTKFPMIELHKLFYNKRMVLGKDSMFILEPEDLDKALKLISGEITSEGKESVLEAIKTNEDNNTMLDLEDKKRKYGKAANIKKAPEAKRCDAYVFSFGKYSGVKITNMTDDDQLGWCKFFLKNSKEKMKKAKKKAKDKTMSHKAVEWWLTKGYKKAVKEGKVQKPTPAKYVFTFGKHEGKKITELSSDRDLGYCSWLYRDMVEKKKGRGTQLIKALRWWLRKHELL
jgi:hypothetical protein